MLQLKGKLTHRSPSARQGRRGFVLFLVCTLALVMMVMVISLSTQKSGAVTQLTRTIEQERAVTLAQAAVNEMLAWVKAGVNDRNSSIGARIHQYWKSRPTVTGPQIVFRTTFSPVQLKMTNQLVEETLGNRAEVSGQLNMVVSQRINGARPSFVGYVELIGKAKYRDFAQETFVKERRELKIVDLSDPFVDKYALFVKSFCRSLNNPKKRIIIQGITPDDATRYSFVYLGNRSYPSCPEFPQGSRSANPPPVILDLDFKEDKHLLGAFYRPAPFQMKDQQLVQASNGNLFFVNPPVSFASIKGSVSVSSDFYKVSDLIESYKRIVSASSQFKDVEGSLGYVVWKDAQSSGGNPAASKVFQSLVSMLMNSWQYHYGYTDFSSTLGSSNSFANRPPFTGIENYAKEINTSNPMRTFGGKMPLLFGENRDTPVYVEGPVFLRFFKIAFLDQVVVPFSLAGETLDVFFSAIPMDYDKNADTFSGKTLNPPVDNRTDKLMSMPVEHFSINNFFFGAGTTPAKTPTAVKGGVEGYDVFPVFDETLKTVSHSYLGADEFLRDRVKEIDGQKVLDLDGVSLIMGKSSPALDLSDIKKYRGKGKIIVSLEEKCDCHIGDISPISPADDSLGIYLMSGRFVVKSNASPVKIYASLVATTCFSDNSQASSSSEGGIEFGGKSVNLLGNLIIDNLFEMRGMPEDGHLKIVHDPRLYFPEYPVRVSVGSTRTLMAVDYNAQ